MFLYRTTTSTLFLFLHLLILSTFLAFTSVSAFLLPLSASPSPSLSLSTASLPLSLPIVHGTRTRYDSGLSLYSVGNNNNSGENLRPDFDAEADAAQSLETIEKLIDSNKIMLFMKGNKLFPQCGFSNTAVQILRALDVEFETFDVLSDYGVREEIKKYSNWPTIPQLYIEKEFVGGADILIEMYQNGELKEMLDGQK